jgi:hypothetical protein
LGSGPRSASLDPRKHRNNAILRFGVKGISEIVLVLFGRGVSKEFKKPHEVDSTRDSFVPGMEKKSTKLKTSSARGQESTPRCLQLGVAPPRLRCTKKVPPPVCVYYCSSSSSSSSSLYCKSVERCVVFVYVCFFTHPSIKSLLMNPLMAKKNSACNSGVPCKARASGPTPELRYVYKIRQR